MFFTRSPTPTSITTAEARTPWPPSRTDSPAPTSARPISQVSSGVGILHEPGPRARPLTVEYAEAETWADVLDLWGTGMTAGPASEQASVYSQPSWLGDTGHAGPSQPLPRPRALAGAHPLAQINSVPHPPSPLSTLKSTERDMVTENLEALARQICRIESHGSRTPAGTPRGLAVSPNFNALMQRLEREASHQAALQAPAGPAKRPKLKQRLKSWWHKLSAPLAKFAPRRSTKTPQTAA